MEKKNICREEFWRQHTPLYVQVTSTIKEILKGIHMLSVEYYLFQKADLREKMGLE